LSRFCFGKNILKITALITVSLQGYLKALGMARTAEVKRDARIGEAEAKRDAQIKEAIAEEERMAAR
jgi:flotillin